MTRSVAISATAELLVITYSHHAQLYTSRYGLTEFIHTSRCLDVKLFVVSLVTMIMLSCYDVNSNIYIVVSC